MINDNLNMIALQKVALQLLSDFSLQVTVLELAGSISKWELEIEMLLRNPGFCKIAAYFGADDAAIHATQGRKGCMKKPDLCLNRLFAAKSILHLSLAGDKCDLTIMTEYTCLPSIKIIEYISIGINDKVYPPNSEFCRFLRKI